VQSWARSEDLAGDVIPCGYDSVFAMVGDAHLPQVLDELVGHLATIFPDERMHFGADEVNAKAFACMRKDARVREWVRKEMGRSAGQDVVDVVDLKEAVASYVGMVAAIGHKHGKKPVFWEEAFTDYSRDGAPPKELLHAGGAMVQVWKGTALDWIPDQVHNVLAAGLGAVKSSDWYLNEGTDADWSYSYRVDPERGVALEQRLLLAGGEAALWGENITEANLFSRAFPRLSAVAERLWSPGSVPDIAAATPRLQALQCRMAARGYNITHLEGRSCKGEGGEPVLLLKRRSASV
jgi:hexosaminidase